MNATRTCTQLPFFPHNLQAVFRKKRFQSPLKPFTSGYKLEDYVIGNQIGKGCNAAVYEAAAPFAPLKEGKGSPVQLREDEDGGATTRSLSCCSLKNFPLAIKMIWNLGVGVLQYYPDNTTHLAKTSVLKGIFLCHLSVGRVIKRVNIEIHVA